MAAHAVRMQCKGGKSSPIAEISVSHVFFWRKLHMGKKQKTKTTNKTKTKTKKGGGAWHDAMVYCSCLQLAAPTG